MGIAERLDDRVASPWWGEHLQRYQWVLSQLPSQAAVLDIACGNGFGTDLLAQHTQGQVVGGDVDQRALADCQSRFARENLSFQQLDVTALDLPDASFEAVVSFETLEHVALDAHMLSELRRVLTPQGILYLSTPNRVVNSPKGVRNPFHVREYTRPELQQLLSRFFRVEAFLGQQYIRYSQRPNGLAAGTEWILYQRGFRKLPIFFRDRIQNWAGGTPHYPRPEDWSLTEEPEQINKCRTFVVRATPIL